CHIFAPSSLRGKEVTRGERLGVVAPDGEANNGGVAHIHMALSSSSRAPLPFIGAYAVEGIALLATTEPNGYYNTAFRSTNVEVARDSADAVQSVLPGDPVVLSATVWYQRGDSLCFTWTSIRGRDVEFVSSGHMPTFTAPSRTGTLEFRVTVTDGTPE